MKDELPEITENRTEEGLSDKNKLLDAIHTGKVLVTWNGNECGKLWERLWKWTEAEGYQSKTCASGLFDNWYTYKNSDEFVLRLKQEITEFNFCGI